MKAAVEPGKLDALFSRFDRADAPGVAVGVAIDGCVAYRRAFGLASVELPALLTTDMRLRIGSISKHMTALGYLLLCERGSAGIDDRVGDYLPELHPVTHTVSMRELMGHIGGLRDVFEIAWEFSGTQVPISSAELLAMYRGLDTVNDPPRRRWQYNNGGYLILGAVIEKIAGCRLEAFMRAELFEPLGMFNSQLRRNERFYLTNSASLHMPTEDGRFARDIIATDISGEGGVVSSIDDMLLWLANMSAPSVGTSEIWRLMATPLSLASGLSTGYALGLVCSTYRGVATIGHGGGVLGGNAQMLKVPAAGLDLCVITNRHDVSSVLLTNQILDQCLEDLEPNSEAAVPVPHGSFFSSSTGKVIELKAQDGCQIVSIDGFDWPFTPTPTGAIVPSVPWSHIQYRITPARGEDGVHEIDFDDYGIADRLNRVAPDRQADPGAIRGRFHAKVADAEIEVEKAAARVRFRGQFGQVSYELAALGPRIWRATSGRDIPWDAVLVFDQDNNGFQFSTGRLRRLHFSRVHALEPKSIGFS